MNERLALALFEIGAVQFGRFRLSSGQISPIYIDLRLMMSDPPTLALAASAYARILNGLTFDLLGAIPYGGLPIGTAVALEMNRPMIFPRKTAKTYGTGRMIEGRYQVGQRVVIIEDVVTSGDSALGGVAVLKSAGLRVQDVVVLLDRQQGAADNIHASGYRLHSVMQIEDLIDTLEQYERITGKQRREVLSAIAA